MIYEGETNEQGELLLLDKWANEAGWRIRVWRVQYGGVRIEFVNAGKPNEPADHALTLTNYRAHDLFDALRNSI